MRSALPSGSFTIGSGLLVGGVSIYVFFRLGQEALGQDGFKPIVSLWFVMFALVPGFFLPLEQEVSRSVAHRRALGDGVRPVVHKVAPVAAAITLLLVVAVALARTRLTNDLFEGSAVVTLALVIALVGYAPFHIARGICSGLGHFRIYSLMIALDGLLRVIACAVFLLAGLDRVGPYALMVAVVPLVIAVGAFASGRLRTSPGTPASWGELAPNLGWLLLGTLCSGALINAGPLTVDLLGEGTAPEVVTRFGNAVLLARIPLFLFQAVNAAMLPRLTQLVTLGNATEFRAVLRRLFTLVGGVGVIGVVGAFIAGPWVLDLVYDGGIDRRTITLLAFASAVYMLAQACAQSVLSMSGHVFVAVGWVTSFASFVATAAWSSDDLFLRVELALITSAAVALAIFMFGLRRYFARLVSTSMS
jgi:O-antigen/teichoic acid export membrane protein